MAERPRKLLGELLIEDGVLTRENLGEALDYQKRHGGLIGQILISHGYINEEDLVAALGRQLNIPYLPLTNYTLNAESVALLEEEFCRRNVFIIVDHDDRRIFVAMADPLNSAPARELEQKFQQKIHVYLSTSTEIFRALDSVYLSTTRKDEMKKAG